MKKVLLWFSALVAGSLLGLLEIGWLSAVMDFIAAVYVRLFQLLAVPTIVLAVITTLVSLGRGQGAGRIFRHTLTYTLLTTIAAAAVGLLLFVAIAPGMLPVEALQGVEAPEIAQQNLSYSEHILGVIPNNIVKPFLEGNVLSLLILAAAVGITLAYTPDNEQKATVVKFLQGLQDLLFRLIHGLVWTLPLGIVAFSAQLSGQLAAGVVADSLGRYIAVVLGGNLLQFFVVLPLFLLARGINPIRTFGKMTPAILMALFTKSSAATLPVTIESAENRMKVQPKVARFVLPICTTINMNGCAAFILITSLFVMQQGGVALTWPTMLSWLFISVISAIGNAGVPMGCYFLTLSLISGTQAPIAVMGIILTIYTIIDMVETAVNVWSDSCVCAMTDHDLKPAEED